MDSNEIKEEIFKLNSKTQNIFREAILIKPRVRCFFRKKELQMITNNYLNTINELFEIDKKIEQDTHISKAYRDNAIALPRITMLVESRNLVMTTLKETKLIIDGIENVIFFKLSFALALIAIVISIVSVVISFASA